MSATKTIRYVGPHDAVEFVDADGREYRCERDQTIAVPAELADRMLEQDTWTAVQAKKKEND